MFKFTLGTFFNLHCSYFPRSSSSLVFCSKVVLRLTLVHSTYTGNRNRNQNSAMNKILAFPLSFSTTAQMKRRYMETILSDLNCENFRKIHRKNRMAFTSTSCSKAEPSHGCFLVNCLNIFQNSYFYKTLFSSCFCVSLAHLMFHSITLVTIKGEMQ